MLMLLHCRLTVGGLCLVYAACTDVNECMTEGTCPPLSNCFNEFGNYTCRCLPGFVLDGDDCTGLQFTFLLLSSHSQSIRTPSHGDAGSSTLILFCRPLSTQKIVAVYVTDID